MDSGLKDIFGYSNLFRGPTARHTAARIALSGSNAASPPIANSLPYFISAPVIGGF